MPRFAPRLGSRTVFIAAVAAAVLAVLVANMAFALPVNPNSAGFPPQQAADTAPVPLVPYLLLAKAHGQNPGPSPGGPSSGLGGNDDRSRARLSGPAAQEIDDRFRDIQTLCGNIREIYLIDCIADQFEIIARSLPESPDFKVLKRAVRNAGRDLARISLCNSVDAKRERDCLGDLTAPRIMPRATIGSKTVRSSRPLRAIQPRHLAVAKVEAEAILDELSTILLRSSENSSRRQEQYVRIVQAINSNKVLLRS